MRGIKLGVIKGNTIHEMSITVNSSREYTKESIFQYEMSLESKMSAHNAGVGGSILRELVPDVPYHLHPCRRPIATIH